MVNTLTTLVSLLWLFLKVMKWDILHFGFGNSAVLKFVSGLSDVFHLHLKVAEDAYPNDATLKNYTDLYNAIQQPGLSGARKVKLLTDHFNSRPKGRVPGSLRLFLDDFLPIASRHQGQCLMAYNQIETQDNYFTHQMPFMRKKGGEFWTESSFFESFDGWSFAKFIWIWCRCLQDSLEQSEQNVWTGSC